MLLRHPTTVVGLMLCGLLGLLLAGCGDATPPVFTTAPAVSGNPNPAAPLAAVLRFATDEPVRTIIKVSDGDNNWELDYDDSRSPADGLAVVGMRADRRHEIRVTIRDIAGNETTAPETLAFTTPPLPDNREEFPPIEITVSKPEQMEPGVTLFNPRRRKTGANKFNTTFGMLLAVDAAGEPVWYYRVNSRISDFEKLRNGNLIVVTQDFRLIELDWLGNTVNQWYAANRPEGATDGIPVEAMTFHHEVDELPNGNIVVLGTESREIDNYYSSEWDADAPRKKQKVMGDIIHEFERDTGKVVWEWKAFDHMDPFRIGYETFTPYWIRRGFPDMIDWSHANNLLYDEADDSLVINFRYQAAAMKIDRKTKEIKWIFGEPSGWGDLAGKVLKADGDVRWPYHHHSPHPTPNGTLLIFDNGNYQSRPFTPPKPVAETYSRAVEYAIDEANMTVREVWESESMGPDRVVSIAMGDVDWLPETQNILVAYGALMNQEKLNDVTWENRARFNQWTLLREYKRTDPPQVIWELVLRDEEPMGWTLFGAERLPRVGP